MKWPHPKHRLLRRRPRYEYDEPPALPAGNHKFDESSGQMYSETFVPIQIQSIQVRDLNWSRPRQIRRNLKTPKVDHPRSLPPLRGSRSLQDAAIEAILANLNDLTFEGIDCLPRHQVLLVWERANERFQVPFYVWTIFSKVLHKGSSMPLSVLRFRQAIELPQLTLHPYTAVLTSTTFDFLASLSITTHFPVPDLASLSGIKNLGVVEIIHTAGEMLISKVSDRLIRSWHEAAIAERAFPVLRILKLWNHKEITSKSLSYLNRFPALALFDVRGCSLNPGATTLATRLGWKPSLDVGTLALFDATCAERAMLMRASAGDEKNMKPLRRAPSHQLPDDASIERLSRGDVAAFLTNPRRSDRQCGPDSIPEWPHFQNTIDMLQAQHHNPRTENDRWTFMNHTVVNKSYKDVTWDFDTYTIFSRIGELRNDRDLAKAGVDVGDQVTVRDELVNSVPLASIRLGPSPGYLLPTRMNNQIKSFYPSMFQDFVDPDIPQLHRFTLGWADNPHPEQDWNDAPPRPDSRNISFIRIKVPSIVDDYAPQAPVMASERKDKVSTGAKRSPTDAQEKSNADSSSKPRSSKIVKNKKQRKLDDVLDSFM